MSINLPAVRTVFLGSDGLRAGWRVLLFAPAVWYLPEVLSWLTTILSGYVLGDSLSVTDIVWYGFSQAASALLVAFALTRVERRTLSWFGFPWRWKVLEPFSWGLLTGGGMITVVMGIAMLSGRASIGGLALHGWELLRYLCLWAGAMILVGFGEEQFYRGYALRALAGGMGFWPAAVLTSILFGAVHYILKPLETVADILNIMLLGLFICFSIRRSGTIWFGIGFHAAFDFFALSLYGAPNTGNDGLPLAKHILQTHIAGPAWLTGGPQGLEASWLLVPLLAGVAWLFNRYQPATRYELPEEGPPVLNTRPGTLAG